MYPSSPSFLAIYGTLSIKNLKLEAHGSIQCERHAHSRALDKPPTTVLFIFDGHPFKYEVAVLAHAFDPVAARIDGGTAP